MNGRLESVFKELGHGSYTGTDQAPGNRHRVGPRTQEQAEAWFPALGHRLARKAARASLVCNESRDS